MTAIGQGEWRVEVQNFNVMKQSPSGEIVGPSIFSETFNSLEKALEFACGQQRLPHYKVVSIEGPSGERMDESGIARRCADRRASE